MPKRFRKWRGDLSLIEFDLGGRKYSIDPNEELAIEETMVAEELSRQAAKMAWVGVVAELASTLEGRREFEVDVMKARLDKRVRAEAKTKPTEPQVRAAIQRHPDLLRAKEAHLQAKELAGKLKALVNAFRSRDFALRELSARQRGEERASHG